MVIEVKEMEYNKIIQGDCLDVMKQLPALSSIMRVLTKIRSENPNLDTRPNQKPKIEDFKHI